MRPATTFVVVLLLQTPYALAQPCDPAAPQVSLYDLGAATYKTFEGGLYAGGSNQRPPSHEQAGRAIAESIAPLGPNQRIVLISIGISNMTQEWRIGVPGDPATIPLTFTSKAQALQATGVVNPQVLIVDGAQGGQDAGLWAAPPDPLNPPWSVVHTRLTGPLYNSSAAEVQIACVKVATMGPTTCIASDGSSLGNAGQLAIDMAGIARNLKEQFPNIRLAYFVSRTYGGYATGGNREPFAFEQGFAIKWMVDAQINASGAYGDLTYEHPDPLQVMSPWLSYGPYLWANGTTPNGLGINWEISDFREDHIHPAAGGVDKAADAMLSFFLSDSTTRPWFGWQCLHGDMDGNQMIDGRDIPPWVATVLDPISATVDLQCRADADNNGVVELIDLDSFASLLVSGT